ncbi:hypothetical protein D0Z07_3136 [Hyphodiscus hymeniophilus]|uniref:Altered inheritance of mitochondria protein 11 n=1 Tax=Hyphodiscus hymeniophilus TaxID=353542 RepID=A0A9P6VM35_9HELO|nr:hypothetical protein D0Z07_3136 [Hyphodiscus hymeniophilus]
MSDRQPTETSQAVPASESHSTFFSQRSRRQLGLFFAGAGFFAVTSLITRRSLVRRYKATVPKFYQPSNRANFEVNGAVEAFEALNIATINVLSVSMMVGGGLLYAFDISSLEDMRQYIRRHIGTDGPRTDQDAEKEIEEWIARTLNLGLKEEKSEEKPKDAEAVSEILARLSKLEEERKRTKPDEHQK